MSLNGLKEQICVPTFLFFNDNKTIKLVGSTRNETQVVEWSVNREPREPVAVRTINL